MRHGTSESNWKPLLNFMKAIKRRNNETLFIAPCWTSMVNFILVAINTLISCLPILIFHYTRLYSNVMILGQSSYSADAHAHMDTCAHPPTHRHTCMHTGAHTHTTQRKYTHTTNTHRHTNYITHSHANNTQHTSLHYTHHSHKNSWIVMMNHPNYYYAHNYN